MKSMMEFINEAMRLQGLRRIENDVAIKPNALVFASNIIKVDDRRMLFGVTHGGKFHADDVFSAALLKTIDPTFQIIRGNPTEMDFCGMDKNVLIFDTGDTVFDHHREPIEVRENGIPYAAFGKLWRGFWPYFVKSEQAYKHFDETFVQPMDLADTKGVPNPMAFAINAFNAEIEDFRDDYECDKAFTSAVDTAIELFGALVSNLQDFDARVITIRQSVRDAVDAGKPYVLLDFTVNEFDYIESISPESIKVVIYPSSHGGISVRALGKDIGDGHFVNRYLFPKALRGHRDELLELYPDINMKFCHASGFMAVFLDLDSATKYMSADIC